MISWKMMKDYDFQLSEVWQQFGNMVLALKIIVMHNLPHFHRQLNLKCHVSPSITCEISQKEVKIYVTGKGVITHDNNTILMSKRACQTSVVPH